MKDIKFLLCFMLALLLAACTQEDEKMEFETTFSDFGYITGDLSIDLTQSAGSALRLEWEETHAANSTLAFYRVQFSASTGFSNPVHEIETDRLGTAAYLEITPAAMNSIAEKAGVRQNSSGTVYWSVRASNGISTKSIADGAKKIAVTRPGGFAAMPEKLYITGAATPGGDNIEQALLLKAAKKKADATQDSAYFNIVVPLKQGEFKLVSAKQGRVRSFGFDDNGKIIEIFEGDNLKNEVPADGVYHLGLNFQTNTADYAKVEQVELIVVRSGQPDAAVAALNYTGDYTWEADYTSLLPGGGNLPSGAMYKFRFTETAVKGGQTHSTYWGSASETSVPPSDATTEPYFYVTRVNNDLKNYYRFSTSVSGTSNSGKAMKAVLVMNPNEANYYHSNTPVPAN